MPEPTLSHISIPELAARLRALALPFPHGGAETEQLAVYLSMLMRWGAAMNLVGAATWGEALENLAADSFYLAGFLDSLPLPAEPCVLDPGAGAGLPGIPLRLVWGRGEYRMVEAREKRAIFLSSALARLKLPRTGVFRGRVEDFWRKHPQTRPDAVISRAFLPRLKVLDLFRERLPVGGLAVFMANESAPDDAPGWRLHTAAPYDGPAGRRWFVAYVRL